MNSIAKWIAGGAGVVLVATFGALSRVDGLHERIGLLLLLYAVAFAAYLAAIVVFKKPRGETHGPLVYIMIVAAICRALLIPADPVMSTDVNRYLWEGRMITHGMNPFAQAPDSPELEFLRDEYYEDINHKHLETIYPPVSQGVFALAAWLRPDPQTQKAVFVLFDLGAILVLMALLRLRGLGRAACAVYAWNPLVIFEAGHSGHVDSVGIFFLLLGLWLIARERNLAGFAALGASFLAKYLAAVLVPFFLRRRRFAPWVGVMAAVVVVGYLPFAGAGDGLFSSLKIYSAEWRFNGLLYKLLYSALGDPQWTRRVVTLVLAAVVIVHSFRQNDPVRFGFVVIATGLLVAPTLYPWYVAWIVPFLCFYRNRAWILFTGLVFVSYWVWEIFAARGVWELPWYLLAVEYAPFYALLLYDAAKSRWSRVEAPV
jgi:hypothetical protein